MSSNFELLQQPCKKLKLKERLRYLAAIFSVAAAVLFIFFYIDGEAPASPPQPKASQSEMPKPVQKTPPAKTVQTATKPDLQQEAPEKPLKQAENKERGYTLHVDNSYLKQLERPKEKVTEPAAKLLEKSLPKPPIKKAQTLQPATAVTLTKKKKKPSKLRWPVNQHRNLPSIWSFPPTHWRTCSKSMKKARPINML